MNDVTALCKKDYYNFLSPYGLGDTMMLCGFAKAWENENKGKIHFIITTSHEVVMKMYGFTNYSLYSFKKEWYKPEFMNIAQSVPLPEKGKIFVAHPHFHKDRLAEFLERTDSVDSDVSFFDFYREFLRLPMDTPFIWAKQGFPVTEALKSKLAQYGPLKDIVLFLPEAQTLPVLNYRFWKEVQKVVPYKKTIIQYALDKKNRTPGIPFVDMTIEEIIALSSVCDSVYAYRSGMCDMIAPFVKKMMVFYPELWPNLKKRYSLERENIVECTAFTKSSSYRLLGCLPLLKIKEFPNLRISKTADKIVNKTIYLFEIIPFMGVISEPQKKYYRLFNFIPLLKIEGDWFTKIKYSLFGGIPLLKVKK